MSSLPCGKLPADLLRSLLASFAPHDPRVVVGPRVGVDAAVIDMGDRYLVAKTDPVTFATDEIGRYAVNVCANDVACCGAVPLWFLATLLLPERGTTSELVEQIFAELSDACQQLAVSLCGGHTEITVGLDRVIVVGQMLGEAPRERLVTSAGAQVGDVLLATKAIAIEGTALLAREIPDKLAGLFSRDEIRRLRELLHTPGISVVREAQLALEAGGVHALHDPTEGGLATGVRELAEASQVGVVVEEERIPVLAECERICRQFQLDPLGLIASGTLLISAAAERADAIVSRLAADGLTATPIGYVVPATQGCTLLRRGGQGGELPRFARDELLRVLG
ncbi:MAG TPA: AIR synthase family protein [Pirellulales bacterium]|jgi:hydrogenase expression/formation protein HypE|nr:AIR synthase family protein [Pirellulales bacterium]